LRLDPPLLVGAALVVALAPLIWTRVKAARQRLKPLPISSSQR
jgi:hypothetical protein